MLLLCTVLYTSYVCMCMYVYVYMYVYMYVCVCVYVYVCVCMCMYVCVCVCMCILVGYLAVDFSLFLSEIFIVANYYYYTIHVAT